MEESRHTPYSCTIWPFILGVQFGSEVNSAHHHLSCTVVHFCNIVTTFLQVNLRGIYRTIPTEIGTRKSLVLCVDYCWHRIVETQVPSYIIHLILSGPVYTVLLLSIVYGVRAIRVSSQTQDKPVTSSFENRIDTSAD